MSVSAMPPPAAHTLPNKLTPSRSGVQRTLVAGFIAVPCGCVIFAAVQVIEGHYPSWLNIFLFAAISLGASMGVTVGLHRYFTHGSFETTKFVQVVLGVLAGLAIEGTISQWVANHKYHHQHSDEPADPKDTVDIHSPRTSRTFLGGLFHAHVGWLMRTEEAPPAKFAAELLEDPVVKRLDRLFVPLVVTSVLLPGLIGWLITGSINGALTALLWASGVRIFLVHQVTWSINSICHVAGQRPFGQRGGKFDRSTNNRWLSVLSNGESWHHNHHAFAKSALHGLLGRQRYFDPSYHVICLLEKVGLAWNVQRIDPDRVRLALDKAANESV